MTVAIPLTPEQEAKLAGIARAAGVTPEDVIPRAVEKVLSEGGETPRNGSARPSFLGALAHLGPAPSARDIDDTRAEMFAAFERDDVA